MILNKGDVVDLYVIPSPPFGLGIICPSCGRTTIVRELPFDVDNLPPHACRNNPTFKSLFVVRLAQGSVEKKTYVASQDGEHKIVLGESRG